MSSAKTIEENPGGEDTHFISTTATMFRANCNTLINSKFTTYLLVLIYVIICLFGNLVTGIIIFKHHRILGNAAEEQVNSSNSGTVFELDWNETIIPHSGLKFDADDFNKEVTNIFGLETNASKSKNSISDPSCYELIDDNIRENAKFWLEGVAILVVGVFGLLGNLISIFVFRRSRGNKGFHTLLIILAIADSLLIMDSIVQKSIMPYFTPNAPLEPSWFKFTYPYFWHPFKGIIVTVTIYLMVAISAERFRAVCYPLSKRQSPYKYAAVVIITSIVLRLPRFFQFKLITLDGVTEYWTTSIMEDVDYIRFSSYWDDLFSMGGLPLGISIFFNLKIYLKIRKSAKMKCDRYIGTGIRYSIEHPTNDELRRRFGSCNNINITNTCPQKQQPYLLRSKTMVATSVQQDMLKHIANIVSQSDNDYKTRVKNNEREDKSEKESSDDTIHNQITMVEENKAQNNDCLHNDQDERREMDIGTMSRNAVTLRGKRKFTLQSYAKMQVSIKMLKRKDATKSLSTSSIDLGASNPQNNEGMKQRSEVHETPPVELHSVSTHLKNKIRRQSTKLKIRTEKSALMLGLIVILFIFTHSYRMALKVYEVALPNINTIERFELCFALKRHHVPVTFYMFFHLNNLFIVINSSITFLICYSVGKDFRKETKALLHDIKTCASISLKYVKRLLKTD